VKEPGCVQAQEALVVTSSDQTVRRCALGVLWVLRWKNKVVVPTTIADKIPIPPIIQQERPEQHIFISYQWNYKKSILQLRDRLQAAGYFVWVDVDNMVGSVLEAMAKAVENAIVMLVCLTQSYKESPNCRTEAEYAFRLKKAVVPVKFESHYVPDGWLGALIGSKLVHDFSEGWTDKGLCDLYRDLGERGKKLCEEVVESHKEHSVLASNTTKCLTVHSWTCHDVIEWLNSSHLQHQQDWFRDIDGPMLTEMISMRKEATDFLYTMLKQNHFSIQDILRLSMALKQLEQQFGNRS